MTEILEDGDIECKSIINRPENKLCEKAGALMARSIPRCREDLRDAVRLEMAGSAYSIFPVVHVSKIKLVKVFPDRPIARLNGSEEDRVDFDEALLPEDSCIQDRDPDEYEEDEIWPDLPRISVHWRGYEDPTWIDEADLTGALLYEFLRERANRNRFGVMQSHEEP
ncbi:hypothetical protein PHMEG_00029614 [Phytophthora megakarya]|uniref:Chromo domain-containing protein n=1 Tax=Phytophthora megakarya TaxID=4795 RepID=A0A225V3R2_9STRA|nr:hypothetical protein PHMEG_00029614 [Phytophthora megakarya]